MASSTFGKSHEPINHKSFQQQKFCGI